MVLRRVERPWAWNRRVENVDEGNRVVDGWPPCHATMCIVCFAFCRKVPHGALTLRVKNRMIPMPCLHGTHRHSNWIGASGAYLFCPKTMSRCLGTFVAAVLTPLPLEHPKKII